MDFQSTTPVALLVFNRPDTARRVFHEIRHVRPPKLLVVADGPREGKAGEAEKCRAVQAIIDTVDWPCEVLKNYSAVNLGCKRRMSSGIDWIFEQVEEAIILEDDCLPNPTFFQFCQELLERYRHDLRIAQISGCNFQFGLRRNSDSYYFSKYNHVWGWASWRNRWQGCYDVNMSAWPRIRDEGWLLDMLGNNDEADRWRQLFDDVHQGKIDTWDYQWTFACWAQGRLTAIPNVNLIANIGFGAEATHTTSESKYANLPAECLRFPLTHPLCVVVNRIMDARVYAGNFAIPFAGRLRQKIRRMLQP